MSFNVAMLEAMQAEGLDLNACIRVLKAGEKKSDPTAADRKRRQRAKSHRDVTRDPPNDNISNPPEVSEANASSPPPWALPVGVSLQIWTDFLTNRKRKRLPNTDTAWKQFLDDVGRVASQTGIPPPELIRQCAAKGWGAIYDPREQRHGQQATVGKSQAAYAALQLDPDEPF